MMSRVGFMYATLIQLGEHLETFTEASHLSEDTVNDITESAQRLRDLIADAIEKGHGVDRS